MRWEGKWEYDEKTGIMSISVYHCGVRAKLLPPVPEEDPVPEEEEEEEEEGVFLCRKCGAMIPANIFEIRADCKAVFVGCDV